MLVMTRISYFFKKETTIWKPNTVYKKTKKEKKKKKGIIIKSFATPNLACTSDDNSSVMSLLSKTELN